MLLPRTAMSALVASILWAMTVKANVVLRQLSTSLGTTSISNVLATSVTESFSSPFSEFTTTLSGTSSFSSFSASSTNFGTTITIPLPSQAGSFKTTVAACTRADGEVIDPIVVIGAPTGTFSPGITKTIPVVPQAEFTTATFYDYPPSNATEVIVIQPLLGVCGSFVTPTTATSEPASPSTSTSPALTCPTKGCSEDLSRAAETLIDAINSVTQLSLQLQDAARKIGDPLGLPRLSSTFTTSLATRPTLLPRSDELPVGGADISFLPTTPIAEVSLGLGRIALTITVAFPSFSSFPAFPPGCDSDTIILAWLEFVRVHQELLSILIGRSGLLERGPVRRDVSGREVVGRAAQGFVGKPVAAALRKLEGVVDAFAVAVVNLVPSRGQCSEGKREELKKSIGKARTSYEG